MQIHTSRFGPVEVSADDIFVFPGGLIGYPKSRHFLLLADAHDAQVVWLQALGNPQLAFAAVNPAAFVQDFRVCVASSQLAPLGQRTDDPLHVLALVTAHHGQLCLNLQAPILLDRARAVGCQVITSDAQPLQHAIATLPPAVYRKSA